MTRRLLLAALAVALAAFAGAGGARARRGRTGRVVRVERKRRDATATLRGCLGLNMDATRFTCFGGPLPQPGDLYGVVDGAGLIGTARVVQAEPSTHDACGAGVAHDVVFDYEGGPPRAPAGQGLVIPVALAGLEADPATVHVLADAGAMRSPSGRAESVWIAIDRDGDQAPDLMATAHEADAGVRASMPPAPPGRSVYPFYLDYWLLERGRWRRVNRDVFFNCY